MPIILLQTNDPVINTENDEKLILKPHLPLRDCGVGKIQCYFTVELPLGHLNRTDIEGCITEAKLNTTCRQISHTFGISES